MRDAMNEYYNHYNNISHTVSTVRLLFKFLTITFKKKKCDDWKIISDNIQIKL